MPNNTKNVNITVTFPGNGNTPSFNLGGDVNGQGAVVIDHGDTDTINWNLNGNQQGSPVTFSPSNGIEWVGSCGNKVGSTWATAPAVSLVTSTQAQATGIANTNNTPGTTAVYLYKINVQVNGNAYSYDPEVDEPGA
jgi:hypothetical protein